MRIHAVQTGTVAIRASQRDGTRGSGLVRLFNTLRDPTWTDPLPIYAWVIEHPEGVIVIDTGETAKTSNPGYFPVWHPYYRLGVRVWVRPEEEIGPRLGALGIALEDVRWVVMTHLHTDHAGGIYHFPKSEFVIARDEYKQASGLMGKVNGYLPQHWPAWFDPRLIDYQDVAHGPFPQSLPLTKAGDVLLVPTVGHAPGHQSVIVRDGDQTIFFAGDVTYTEQHLLSQVVDGVTQDVAAARQTLARTLAFVQQQPTIYLPSHDPGSAARLEARQTVVTD